MMKHYESITKKESKLKYSEPSDQTAAFGNKSHKMHQSISGLV